MAKTKADLADAIYRVHGGLSRHESRRIVDLILGRIRTALVVGDSVLISGFGTFRVRDRRPRTGRNPRTGHRVPIAAARRPVFHPSRLMVRGMNAPGKEDPTDAR
ncbi:MAG: integration host factor subunit alpha [Acidobacteriota bacterium]